MNTENNENQEEKKTSQQMHKVKTIIIDTGKIRQTKAFARQDGAILGAVWIVSFVCTMLAVDPQGAHPAFLSGILRLSIRDRLLRGNGNFCKNSRGGRSRPQKLYRVPQERFLQRPCGAAQNRRRGTHAG